MKIDKNTKNLLDLLLNNPNLTTTKLYNAINKLPSDEKNIIVQSLGLYNNKTVKESELARIYNTKQITISRKIDKIYKELDDMLNPNRDFIDFIKEFKDYTIDEFYDAIKRLSKTERNIVILKFGLNGNNPLTLQEISKKLNISYGSVTRHYTSIKLRIKNLLEEKSNLDRLISQLPGCNINTLLKIINILSNSEQNIIKLHLGLLNMSELKNKDIAELLNISQSNVSSTINNAYNKIKNIYDLKIQINEAIKNGSKLSILDVINNTDLFTNKKEDILLSLFKIEDLVFKDNPVLFNKFLDSIKGLTKKERDIVILKLGLSNNGAMNNSDIAKHLNISKKNVSSTYYRAKIKSKVKML